MILLTFFALIVAFGIGVPIAWAICLASVVGLSSYSLPLGVIAERFFAGINSESMVTVPMFLLMANMIDLGEMSGKIVNFANAVFGRIRGCLAMADVFACMIFSSLSGSTLTEVASVGSIMIPMMKKEGYNENFSAALTAAAAMLGPIIPPSILFIIYAHATGLSIFRMFLAGVVPGFVLGVAFLFYAYAVSKKYNYGSYHKSNLKEVGATFKLSLPVLLIPAIIFVGVFGGIFTVTESAAAAAFYALLVAIVLNVMSRGRLFTGKTLFRAFTKSASDTAVVGTIMCASSLLSTIFTISGAPQTIVNVILAVTANKIVILVLINLFLLLMGMFFTPAAGLVIATPILLPIAQAVGMDPVHYGVMSVMNLQIGTLTPPVANSAYMAARIAKVPFSGVVRSSLPLMALSLCILLLVTYIPQISLWLPAWLMG